MGAPAGIDWDWARATGGVLSAQQKRQLMIPLIRTAASHTAGRLRIALGLRGGGGIDLDTLRIPDSRLARDAEQQAGEELPPYLLEHSYRTYLFGSALAALDGVAVDEELAYVTCLLHDIQLEHPTPGRCFAVVGGERAERFALDRGAEPARASAIGAAIAGHLTAGAADDLADPAGFVSAGAFVDVAGVRMHELRREWVDEVVRRHPRHRFGPQVLAAFRAEAAAVPAGRTQWCLRYGAFPLLIRIAPVADRYLGSS